jgi:metal-responsive CopG/Arc/MetJ family transcriptional regulator
VIVTRAVYAPRMARYPVAVRLTTDEIERLDELARERGTIRSEVLRDALRRELDDDDAERRP